jgi:hypothetical protein
VGVGLGDHLPCDARAKLDSPDKGLEMQFAAEAHAASACGARVTVSHVMSIPRDEFLDVGWPCCEGADHDGQVQQGCAHFAEAAEANERWLAFQSVIDAREEALGSRHDERNVAELVHDVPVLFEQKPLLLQNLADLGYDPGGLLGRDMDGLALSIDDEAQDLLLRVPLGVAAEELLQ